MDLRRQQEEERGYNPSPSSLSSSPPTPPPLKESTFSRPLLPLNSTLLLQQAGHNHKLDEQIQDPRNGGAGARRYSLTPSPFNSVSLRQHAVTTDGRQHSFAPSEVTWQYRECQRNHAAGVGGHVVDGCCEFMLGDDVTLKCAACGCHRSFHRKEPTSASEYPNNGAANQRLIPHQLPSPCFITPSIDHSSSTEEMQISPSKKRFRTKFTPEQKEKMLEFADRLSWKFQKTDDAAIDGFCKESGLSRQVFKVWMHNNKYTYKKQEQPVMTQQEGPQHEHQQQIP
ncbi:hypothetical protein LUZ60_012851 [Juncus effusus]|nr:hypothetical protein LUZ60_012851 [Juncus effusus]